jgi:hypothetical protein
MPRGPWCRDKRGNITRVKGEGGGSPLLLPPPRWMGEGLGVGAGLLCCAKRKKKRKTKVNKQVSYLMEILQE